MTRERVPKKSEIKRALKRKGLRPGDTVWYLYPHYYAIPTTVRLFIVTCDQMVDITEQAAQLLGAEYSDGTRAISLESFGAWFNDEDAIMRDSQIDGEEIVRLLSLELYDCQTLPAEKV